MVNMMSGVTVLAVILLTASQCHGLITVKPSVLIFDENVTVTSIAITCESPPQLKQYETTSLLIARNDDVLGMAELDSGPILDYLNGVFVSGDARYSISVVIPQASCHDEGVFVCAVYYIGPKILYANVTYFGENLHYVNTKLNVIVKPGRQVTLTVSPNKAGYSLNENIQLSCSGLIGSKSLSLQVFWRWEYKDYLNNSWIQYTEIFNTVPEFINDSCQNFQVSSIKRTLTLEDNRRIYRCYLLWNGTVYADNAPVHLFLFADEVEKDKLWIIILAVIGGVSLCLILGSLIFYFRRSRNIPIIVHSPEENEGVPEHDEEYSDPSRNNIAVGMKTFLNLGTIFHNESELANNRLTVEDVTEDASSRGSMSSQGTMRNIHQ